jgi:hypothetical protein
MKGMDGGELGSLSETCPLRVRVLNENEMGLVRDG